MVTLRAARGTPRPVEALPCGSMSTTRVGSPTAASAVPRLMAVVVLPTPPFWLATTSTRGFLVGSDMRRQLPQLQYHTRRIGQARDLPDFHLPRFMGFRQFSPYILTLEEQANAVRAREILCIGQEPGQWRAGPRRDHIERVRRRVFHAPVFDENRQLHSLRHRLEEFAFFAGGFEQGHPQAP